MGYWSRLHLVDVRIKDELIPKFRKLIDKRTHHRNEDLECFFRSVMIDCDGFLQFSPGKDGGDAYVPDEDDGSVPALDGKWYNDESIAKRLRKFCEKGGRIILHSIEADGCAWGWEFDGRGRMRELALVSVGRWMAAGRRQ